MGDFFLLKRAVCRATTATYLGFQLEVVRSGKLVVTVARALRNLYCAANGIFAIPHCAAPFLRMRLISAMALPHADYVFGVWGFLRGQCQRQRALFAAYSGVVKRALGLHRYAATAMACAAAGVVPPRIRAGG